MNNKGFTLVELLATIVVLGIVLGIATISVISIINTSKEKAEAAFTKNLGDAIQSYIADNSLRWTEDDSIDREFVKCNKVDESGDCLANSKTETQNLYNINGIDGQSGFFLKNLIEGHYIQGDKIINPRNKKNCLSNDNDILVNIYKDDDSVYYYYVDLSEGFCDVDPKNKIVSNIPKNVCVALKESDDYEWDNTESRCIS